MHIESLRDYCLSLPDVEETLPFGPDTLVFKIHNKVFLLTGLDSAELRFNVKCDPDKAEELRAMYPSVLPGFHMNKKHWNTIVADGTVSDRELKEWIRDSYDLVATAKKTRKPAPERQGTKTVDINTATPKPASTVKHPSKTPAKKK